MTATRMVRLVKLIVDAQVVCAALIGSLAACTTTSGGDAASNHVTTPTAPSTGTLTLHINDASTGTLLPGASYTLALGGQQVGLRNNGVSATGEESYTLAPGTVDFTAFKSGYSSSSMSGILAAGQFAELHVQLSKNTSSGGGGSGGGGSGSVTMHFKDGAGAGLQGVTYTLTYPGGSVSQTGNDGAGYTNVPAGTIGLSASKSGYANASTSGTLSAGGSLTLSVTLNASSGGGGGSSSAGTATVSGGTTTNVCVNDAATNSVVMNLKFSNGTFQFIFPNGYRTNPVTPVAFKYYHATGWGQAAWDDGVTHWYTIAAPGDFINDAAHPGTLTMTISQVSPHYTGTFTGTFYSGAANPATTKSIAFSGTFDVPYPSTCR